MTTPENPDDPLLRSAVTPPAHAPEPGTLATVRDLITANRAALVQALPRAVSIERFLRVCLTTIARTPELQRCTAQSLYGCILQSAQLGLEPGLLNQAHFVPYYNPEKRVYEAQFQIGYQGLRLLAERYGDIIDGDQQVVHERDEFAYTLGTEPSILHRPPIDVQDRGPITHFYAWALPRDGKLKLAVMTRAEVEAHRDQYVRRKKDGSLPPSWVTSFEAMGLKTVMRRCYKFLARSPELQEALALDERAEANLAQHLGAELELEDLASARAANTARLQAVVTRQTAAPPPEAATDRPPPEPEAGPTPTAPAPTEASLPYREALRTLIHRGLTASSLDAWWRSVPEALRAELTPTYQDALTIVSPADRRPR